MLFLSERLVNIRNWLIQNKKAVIPAAIIFTLIFVPLLILSLTKLQEPQVSKALLSAPTVTPSVKPTLIPFAVYKKPTLSKSDQYNIYLLGDSMTHAFGPRGGIFTELLTKAYTGPLFEVSNYAEANQSILLLPKRLSEPVQADHDLLLSPVIDGKPDVIIIESFGYNPLSQFGISEGLKKQEEILTQVMTTLTNRFPDTVIMFLATIAPDKKTYAQNVNPASADDRWAQAEERIEYITHHIDFAEKHNIPLINAYQESLDFQGDGDTKYINPDDNIHPSAEGLIFLGSIMTRRIIEENIFPKQE